jgi:hypothetical protein
VADRWQAGEVVKVPAGVDITPHTACCLRNLSRLGRLPSLGAQLQKARLEAPCQLVRTASALERLCFGKIAEKLRVAVELQDGMATPCLKRIEHCLPEDVAHGDSGKRLILAGVEQLMCPESCGVPLLFVLVAFILPVGVTGQIEQTKHDVPRRAIPRLRLLNQAREPFQDPDWQFPSPRVSMRNTGTAPAGRWSSLARIWTRPSRTTAQASRIRSLASFSVQRCLAMKLMRCEPLNPDVRRHSAHCAFPLVNSHWGSVGFADRDGEPDVLGFEPLKKFFGVQCHNGQAEPVAYLSGLVVRIGVRELCVRRSGQRRRRSF